MTPIRKVIEKNKVSFKEQFVDIDAPDWISAQDDDFEKFLLSSHCSLLEAVVEMIDEQKINDGELGLGKEYDKALSDLQNRLSDEIKNLK